MAHTKMVSKIQNKKNSTGLTLYTDDRDTFLIWQPNNAVEKAPLTVDVI